MIKEFQKYGFKHLTAFWQARNIPLATYEAIVAGEGWSIHKYVLRHKECPDSIRDAFVKDEVWYKRFVAFYARNAPIKYRNMAMKDPDRRVSKPRIREVLLNPRVFLRELKGVKE